MDLKSIPEKSKNSFVLCSVLNILWNFLALQVILGILFLNVSVFFPKALPSGHIFVLDSADYIEEIYYFGSGPVEMDDSELKHQWFQEDTHPA